ncbi:hypothetical protein, partial [Priestia megaterium]|uniref:hypothetical protein n=1 Tax=Priestia megaterium TaxID=1404 RepID=UPI002ECCFE79|nr:hypothetical protein [Priestia megaterium]
QKPLMLFSLLQWETAIYRKGTNVVDIITRNINAMAMREIDEVTKEKKISSQGFLKVQLEKSLDTEKKEHDKRKR